ncbi:hypothetical protein HPB52_017838 [Rhipicephalus sanguineus]|uniref:C2H2-type domain-containing protein n=1 Tax=Rhipicephalus sanguineus TaxID=34632 RepID=A0A9D4PK80_RHISA|nr:hypothetical protein HPB52_017838 [Rhipicephalus sanguineus]
MLRAEYEDEDECLTCNVCERSFPSARRLSQHQQRKRHFGCPVAPAKRQHRGDRGCDAVLVDEDDDLDDEDDDEDEESSDEDTDSDGLDPGPKAQELERLL